MAMMTMKSGDSDFNWKYMENYRNIGNFPVVDLGCRMQQRIERHFGIC
jgi:hypothetical protein